MKVRPWIAACSTVAAAVALAVGSASADPPHWHDHPHPGYDHMDGRFGHNHYYPARGYYFHDIPRERFVVRGGYYYSGGVWYASRGPGFVVVGAPIGVFVPVLPSFYTTVWFGGVPYYYANDTYYQWVPAQNQYEVVAPPGAETAAQIQPPPDGQGQPPPQSSSGDNLFIYPKNGQNDQQQANDKYECHKWANQQSGFDPTQAGGGVPPEQNASAHAAYDRAIGACLEGRGYTVK
jgi:Family of unknown function (DUF6515)